MSLSRKSQRQFSFSVNTSMIKPLQSVFMHIGKYAEVLQHRVKSDQIRSFSDPHFPVCLGLNTEIYGVDLRIQSEYVKLQTR